MLNKIFNKFVALLVFALASYFAVTVFIIFPKISDFFYKVESHELQKQLNHLNEIVNASSVYMKNIEKVAASKAEIEFEKSVVVNNLKELIMPIKVMDNGFVYILENNDIIINKHHFQEEFYSQKDFYTSIDNASKSDQFFEYQMNGTSQLSLVAYNEYFNWYIVLNVPKEELYKEAISLNQMILNITLAILIFVFVVGFMLTKKLLEPINQLSKNVLKIKNGNLKIRNNVTSNDEVGILAQQFDVMLDTLENSIHNLEDEVEKRTNELKTKLHYDDITKLPNRLTLLEKLCKQSKTVILVDINSFNDINELYGYKVGNEVLFKFGRFLDTLAKENDSEAFKIYGNVFAIMFHGEGMFQFDLFENFIAKLLETSKKEAIEIDSLEIKIFTDITLGVAICQENALKKANIALQKAKKQHRTFIVYNSEIDRKQIIQDTIFWRNKIEDAIENNKIVPFSQAIVNKEQQIIKYEMLMRMKDQDEHGNEIYISPFKFLDISVKTKQYLTLSNVMIDKSLSLLEKTDKLLSINISFLDIDDLNFIDFLDEKISKIKKEDLSRIVFEILESDNITDYEIFEEFIIKYRKKGIKIAIDDFGTGYSNFSHIMKIRPDYLKIDASLIRYIDTDRESYELVKSIVAFSKELKMKTIAEFVHSKEVFDLALELGIDEFQGYYFSKPEIDFM